MTNEQLVAEIRNGQMCIRDRGYVTGIALDDKDEIIGYQFVSLGKMTDFIKKGDDPNTEIGRAHV